MNQFIVQRVLGARDIWHARMGMVMAGYAKLFLPLIIVLPGLILFARHPEFMLGDWADANHRADGGFVVLVREFFPGGPARVAAGGADLRRAVHRQLGGQCHGRDPHLRHLCAADQSGRDGKAESPLRHLGFHGGHRRRHRHGHRHQPHGVRASISICRPSMPWWRRPSPPSCGWACCGSAPMARAPSPPSSPALPPASASSWSGYLWVMPGWFYPFGNQAPVCLSGLGSGLHRRHPGPSGAHPGNRGKPRHLLEFGRNPGAGLGEHWYSSVVLWAGLSLVLTLAAMVVFSQIFFPTGAGP